MTVGPDAQCYKTRNRQAIVRAAQADKPVSGYDAQQGQ